MTIPTHIAEWLQSYQKFYTIRDSMLRCPACGSWFQSIDHLAPYHWEMCYCGKCNKFLHQIAPPEDNEKVQP